MLTLRLPASTFCPSPQPTCAASERERGSTTRSRANYSADGGKAVPTRASALSCATSFRHRSSPAAGFSPPGAGRAETRRGSGSGRWHAQTPSERTSAHSSGRRGRCCRPLRHRPPLRRRRRPLLPSRRCRRPLLLLPRHRLHILAAPAWSCSKTTATGWTARAATARVRPEARRSLAPPTSRLWGMAVSSSAWRIRRTAAAPPLSTRTSSSGVALARLPRTASACAPATSGPRWRTGCSSAAQMVPCSSTT
mmetsp:Transcript_46177/g.153086  ORF Transcript_46177/g.153086 Transcript_46177/m.153086 type:complete len:252 (+) Transcript_46177:352-1107(+)